VLREQTLLQLGGVEKTLELRLAPALAARAEPLEERVEVSRTSRDGKTSAVHFMRFPLSRKQVEAAAGPAVVACTHPFYGHSATLSPDTLEEIKRDLA
jgi:hypothetical protein